jgi:hypothetical protein
MNELIANNAIEAGYPFLVEPDEPSVSYAIIAKAAGWGVDVSSVVEDGSRKGAIEVTLTKRNHRLVIGAYDAVYFIDGLSQKIIRNHEELVNLILHGPNGGIWQVGASR